MPDAPPEHRQLAAIMFTDMVGYSALAQRDQALALELLEEHREIARSLFPRFNGTEIKTIGDAFLVEFQSALEAAQCAIEMQRTLAKRNHDVAADRRIDVRVGIHIGDVVHRGGDVYGDGVNIASRIQAVAGAGGICVSMDVERQIHNALEARLKKLAPTELKNIQVPMDLYRVVLPWEKDVQLNQAARSVAARARQKKLLPWAVAAFFALAVIGGLVWWRQLRTAAQTPPVNTAAPTAHSVAVLPFVNMSPDKENEYLSDGITEDLCTALSQIKGLHVPARTSSFVFKGKTEDIRKIGGQLNVGTVLEGSVSKAGDKLRISAQLVNVTDGFHLWAANYDREMTDILDIRSDISRRVVEALKVQLGVEETQRLVKKPTENLEAYDAYLLGRFELNKFTEKGFTNGLANFQQAIALDPKFALAYASLADAYNTIGYWGYLPPKEAFPEARKAAQKALELDPDLAEAHGALAYTEFQYEWKFKEAEEELKKAIRLNPNSVSARLRYAEYLFDFQQAQEGYEQLERARELDPLSIEISFYSVAVPFFARDFDRAVERLQKTISMDPNNAWAYHLLGAIFYQKKMPAQAFTAHEKSNRLEGIFSDAEMADMRKAYETAGLSACFRKENEFRQKRIAERKYQSPLKIALNYACAGADSEALDWLERAADERTPWLPELKADPTWDAIRSQPRFVALLKKIGLEK
jgi:TolB-like protein/class 3 adenylate cyclase/cytochrome c-type biogenesis protein CcmH/NrfG